MSKSSRNQPVAFPADAPVIDAESTVDASEAPETSESASETISNAPEAVSEAPATLKFTPQRAESMSSQHEVAQHIAALLAEEDAEMATLEPPPSEKADLEAELKEISMAGVVILPDGSVRVPVTIPPDDAEILRAWADSAGEPFETYLETIVSMALSAIITGGAVAG